MSEAVLEILAAAARLSEPERATIAHELLITLGGSEAGPEGFEAELDRRIDEIKAGTAKGSPAEEVFARLRAKRA